MFYHDSLRRLTYARTGVRHTIMTQPVTWRGKLRRVVYSNHFNNVIVALIVGNAALLGIEIDVSARVGQELGVAECGVTDLGSTHADSRLKQHEPFIEQRFTTVCPNCTFR